MKFLDPMPCFCTSCQTGSLQRVSALFSLAARCENCGALLTKQGERMRSARDKATSDYFALCILDSVACAANVELTDEMEDVLLPSEQLRPRTLNDLADAFRKLQGTGLATDPVAAIKAAVEIEFPKAQKPLDFHIPIQDAIEPDRHCEPPASALYKSNIPPTDEYYSLLARMAKWPSNQSGEFGRAIRDILRRRNEP